MNYQDIITNQASEAASHASAACASRCFDVLSYLASGMSEEEIISDFPDLT